MNPQLTPPDRTAASALPPRAEPSSTPLPIVPDQLIVDALEEVAIEAWWPGRGDAP